MNINPKKCRRDPKVLCGIVKNVGNCPYPTIEHCNDNNTTNWFGMQNLSFGTLTLKRYNYNHFKVKLSIMEDTMCSGCNIIWNKSLDKCPVCGTEIPYYMKEKHEESCLFLSGDGGCNCQEILNKEMEE